MQTRQQLNLEARRSDLLAGRSRWSSRPSVLEFGTTSACNLKCPMCAHSDPGHRVLNAGKQDRNRFYDEVMDDLSLVKPFTLSEPLLSDLDELIPRLERSGGQLELVTNAALLDERRLELILPHLHRITFSVDSHIPEVYDSIRVPTRFALVDANIKAAMPRLLEAGVLVRVNLVLHNRVIEHLEEFVDYVVDAYGIRYIDVFELVPYTEQGEPMDPFVDPGPEATGAALERMVSRAKERDVRLDLIVREPHTATVGTGGEPPVETVGGSFERHHQELRQAVPGFCEQVMSYLKVQPDGTAFPCCKSPKELALGNVFQDGFEAVWNSKAARRLRDSMFAADPPEACKGCLFHTFSRETERDSSLGWRVRARRVRNRFSWRLEEFREGALDGVALLRKAAIRGRISLGRRLHLPKIF